MNSENIIDKRIKKNSKSKIKNFIPSKMAKTNYHDCKNLHMEKEKIIDKYEKSNKRYSKDVCKSDN